jgi:hypothetical protein
VKKWLQKDAHPVETYARCTNLAVFFYPYCTFIIFSICDIIFTRPDAAISRAEKTV